MPKNNVPSLSQVLKHRQNESLERLAFAAEAKANVAKEQYMFNFYMSNPTSAASIAWFSTKAIEYSNANTSNTTETNVGLARNDAVDVVDVDVVDANDVDVDNEEMFKDGDDDDDGSHFDNPGLYIPGGLVRDVALDNVVQQQVYARPPSVIVVGSTNDTTTSDESQESLPPTQRLVSAFNTSMLEDSQRTRLE